MDIAVVAAVAFAVAAVAAAAAVGRKVLLRGLALQRAVVDAQQRTDRALAAVRDEAEVTTVEVAAVQAAIRDLQPPRTGRNGRGAGRRGVR